MSVLCFSSRCRLMWLSERFCKLWKVSGSVRWCICVTGRCFCSFLPEPPAAGGGDVVVSAAGVDGCLDFSLAALWRNREEGFFLFLFWCHSVISHLVLATPHATGRSSRINKTLGSLWKPMIFSFGTSLFSLYAAWWRPAGSINISMFQVSS